MKTKHTEIEMLQKALEILQKTIKLTVDIKPNTVRATHGPDAVIRIALQDMEWHFAVGIKNKLTRAGLILAVLQLRKFPQKGLLVARYITPQMADQLKEMDIPFVDTAGNAYINEPPLFIYIKGNKPTDTYRPEPTTRAFRPAGLQVVFAFLCNPGLENAPFREIAKAATVALGTVGRVIQDLRQMGYLIDMGTRGRRLIRKDDLLARWVTTYPEHLRPKQLIARYTAANHDWWRYAELHTFKAYWGGEIAATILTKYLKPQVATIYTNQPLGQLLLKNKIKKDPHGDIEILKAFWEFEYNWPHRNLVHPVLIYADLLATGDARNIETAQIIYEQELTRLIWED
ncbi:MAG: hypothetical protein IMF18_11765 [Proteobacteria bacterium]|nr:hypothetical protein [Pseudomonadota bacterium]